MSSRLLYVKLLFYVPFFIHPHTARAHTLLLAMFSSMCHSFVHCCCFLPSVSDILLLHINGKISSFGLELFRIMCAVLPKTWHKYLLWFAHDLVDFRMAVSNHSHTIFIFQLSYMKLIFFKYFQEIKSLISVLDINLKWVEEPADHVNINFIFYFIFPVQLQIYLFNS